jgi:hypothetical protein
LSFVGFTALLPLVGVPISTLVLFDGSEPPPQPQRPIVIRKKNVMVSQLFPLKNNEGDLTDPPALLYL